MKIALGIYCNYNLICSVVTLWQQGLSPAPDSKFQNIIIPGLKGRYPSAMGIAHGIIIVPSQGLKGRHTIAIGITCGIDKTPKKPPTKTKNIYELLSVRD